MGYIWLAIFWKAKHEKENLTKYLENLVPLFEVWLLWYQTNL